MDLFTGFIVYLLTWWVVLFAVLPFGVRQADPDEVPGGWGGVPEKAQIGRKFLITSAVAAVIWLIIFAMIEIGIVDFRQMAAGLEP